MNHQKHSFLHCVSVGTNAFMYQRIYRRGINPIRKGHDHSNLNFEFFHSPLFTYKICVSRSLSASDANLTSWRSCQTHRCSRSRSGLLLPCALLPVWQHNRDRLSWTKCLQSFSRSLWSCRYRSLSGSPSRNEGAVHSIHAKKLQLALIAASCWKRSWNSDRPGEVLLYYVAPDIAPKKR